jgi:hypothetical protein
MRIVDREQRDRAQQAGRPALFDGDIRERAGALGQEPKLRIATRAGSAILGVKSVAAGVPNRETGRDQNRESSRQNAMLCVRNGERKSVPLSESRK